MGTALRKTQPGRNANSPSMIQSAVLQHAWLLPTPLVFTQQLSTTGAVWAAKENLDQAVSDISQGIGSIQTRLPLANEARFIPVRVPTGVTDITEAIRLDPIPRVLDFMLVLEHTEAWDLAGHRRLR